MNRSKAGLLLFALCLPLTTPLAEDVKSSMQSLVHPLRGLQPYLVNEEAFTNPENREAIEGLLQTLRQDFHSLSQVPSRYKKLPGFETNLENTTDLIDDATRRFNEKKASYAWWRLQRLPTDCFTCHSTYKVSAHYSNDAAIDPSLNSLERARFLLATRQFVEAQKTLLSVLHDPEYLPYYDQTLRSLLIVVTRISKKPRDGAKLFEDILVTTKLPEDDSRSVRRWIKGLTDWSKSPPVPNSARIATGEKLIRSGLSHGIDFEQDDVALLRGTAMVHDALETGALSSEQRRKGLYMVGLAYSNLPLFFTEGWGEMYLEQCIEEFPNTHEAKLAYTAYRRNIFDEFTGSSGTHLPDEVRLHLEELRKKAYGEPSFDAKI